MRTSLFTLLLLLATATFAQAPVTVVLSVGSNCPVSMAAQREAFGRTEWIVSLEDSHDPAIASGRRSGNTGVHVELNASKARPLSQVRVAVDFAKPTSGVMLVETRVSSAPDMQKTFELSASGGSASRLSGSLLLGSAVFVTRVHLLGITYADGSTWEPAADSSCSIKPSLLLPVDTH